MHQVVPLLLVDPGSPKAEKRILIYVLNYTYSSYYSSTYTLIVATKSIRISYPLMKDIKERNT